MCDNEQEELQRFGVWSPEAKSMGLPSYRTIFLFLALVALEVVHAYLIMRIEQKPEKPSPLSVKQLMRELREGLQVTLYERHLACKLVLYIYIYICEVVIPVGIIKWYYLLFCQRITVAETH